MSRLGDNGPTIPGVPVAAIQCYLLVASCGSPEHSDAAPLVHHFGRERPVSTRDPETTDTAPAMRAAHAAMVRQLSKSERFIRALALSAYVRNLAWQGALRHSGSRGEAATVDRYMTQLYGAKIALAFRAACGVSRE